MPPTEGHEISSEAAVAPNHPHPLPTSPPPTAHSITTLDPLPAEIRSAIFSHFMSTPSQNTLTKIIRLSRRHLSGHFQDLYHTVTLTRANAAQFFYGLGGAFGPKGKKHDERWSFWYEPLSLRLSEYSSLERRLTFLSSVKRVNIADGEAAKKIVQAQAIIQKLKLPIPFESDEEDEIEDAYSSEVREEWEDDESSEGSEEWEDDESSEGSEEWEDDEYDAEGIINYGFHGEPVPPRPTATAVFLRADHLSFGPELMELASRNNRKPTRYMRFLRKLAQSLVHPFHHLDELCVHLPRHPLPSVLSFVEEFAVDHSVCPLRLHNVHLCENMIFAGFGGAVWLCLRDAGTENERTGRGTGDEQESPRAVRCGGKCTQLRAITRWLVER
ncbi:hypothetical protein IAT38_006922 [Cryptococcus sp. DSM 104549]